MLSLRSIWREAGMQLAGCPTVRARSFETKVSQDDASGDLWKLHHYSLARVGRADVRAAPTVHVEVVCDLRQVGWVTF